MAEITAEMLAAKAEAKRQQVAQEKAETPPDLESESKIQTDLVTETEPSVCGRCEQQFDRIVAVVSGRRFRVGPPVCGSCVGLEEQQRAVPVGVSPEELLKLLKDAGVNERRHGKITLNEWDSASHGEKPLGYARMFVQAALTAGPSDPIRGLYVCGPPGTAKTQLAVSIVRDLFAHERFRGKIVMDRAERLVVQVRDTYRQGGTEALLAKRERAEVWVLDDFGAENAAEDVLRVFTDLLSAREGWPTIITSNLEPDQVAERWTTAGWARLVSRLGPQNFRTVRTRGSDRRLAE